MLTRIKYGKTHAGRFLSHLDLMRAWQRAIRRAELPLAFSQGFNPHPKLSFGSALAVGTTSSGEYMDMALTEDIDPTVALARLETALPPALAVYELREIPQESRSLMAIIDRAVYEVTCRLTESVDGERLAAIQADFLARENIMVQRFKKNSREQKTVDIRPGVLALAAAPGGDSREIRLRLTVQTGSQFNVKPDEVVFGLMTVGLPAAEAVLATHREGLYVADGQRLLSPMAVI